MSVFPDAYIPGGSGGDSSNWAAYPATGNVQLARHTLGGGSLTGMSWLGSLPVTGSVSATTSMAAPTISTGTLTASTVSASGALTAGSISAGYDVSGVSLTTSGPLTAASVRASQASISGALSANSLSVQTAVVPALTVTSINCAAYPPPAGSGVLDVAQLQVPTSTMTLAGSDANQVWFFQAPSPGITVSLPNPTPRGAILPAGTWFTIGAWGFGSGPVNVSDPIWGTVSVPLNTSMTFVAVQGNQGSVVGYGRLA